MKTKPSKQPKQAKLTVRLKDIKPRKDAKGGRISPSDISFVHKVDKSSPVLSS